MYLNFQLSVHSIIRLAVTRRLSHLAWSWFPVTQTCIYSLLHTECTGEPSCLQEIITRHKGSSVRTTHTTSADMKLKSCPRQLLKTDVWLMKQTGFFLSAPYTTQDSGTPLQLRRDTREKGSRRLKILRLQSDYIYTNKSAWKNWGVGTVSVTYGGDHFYGQMHVWTAY